MRLCVLCLALVSVGCTTNVRPPAVIENTSLPRPVVVIGGIGDPFYTATQVGRLVKREAGEDRVLGVSPGLAWSFDDAARTVIEAVERHFPDDDPATTTEVDVIGISMGGLTARHAAVPGNGTGQTLNVRRMYTICAPHTGAQGADFFGFFGTALAMRTGSPFLTRLRGRERGGGRRLRAGRLRPLARPDDRRRLGPSRPSGRPVRLAAHALVPDGAQFLHPRPADH